MGNTPKRDYPIPDPGESIFPQIRDMIMAVDADVDALPTDYTQTEIDAMLRCVENEVAQQRLPMPAVVEEVVPQVRELYEHFQPSREVVKLRDQFFEELSAVI